MNDMNGETEKLKRALTWQERWRIIWEQERQKTNKTKCFCKATVNHVIVYISKTKLYIVLVIFLFI